MTRKDDAMKRLIEEIVWVMNECFVGAGKVPDHDYFSVLHDYAKATITRIGKAYADGLPLPDEVGRFKMRHPMNELDDGDLLIALRKEGTGKEEG